MSTWDGLRRDLLGRIPAATRNLSMLAVAVSHCQIFFSTGSGSISCWSGESTSPNGGVGPPAHQTDPLTKHQVDLFWFGRRRLRHRNLGELRIMLAQTFRHGHGGAAQNAD